MVEIRRGHGTARYGATREGEMFQNDRVSSRIRKNTGNTPTHNRVAQWTGEVSLQVLNTMRVGKLCPQAMIHYEQQPEGLHMRRRRRRCHESRLRQQQNRC